MSAIEGQTDSRRYRFWSVHGAVIKSHRDLNPVKVEVSEHQNDLALAPRDKSTLRARRAFYLFRGSLAQHRLEYAIPQRCADAVVSRREFMMSSVMLKQW
jgi:hypothetical protein